MTATTEEISAAQRAYGTKVGEWQRAKTAEAFARHALQERTEARRVAGEMVVEAETVLLDLIASGDRPKRFGPTT